MESKITHTLSHRLSKSSISLKELIELVEDFKVKEIPEDAIISINSSYDSREQYAAMNFSVIWYT